MVIFKEENGVPIDKENKYMGKMHVIFVVSSVYFVLFFFKWCQL